MQWTGVSDISEIGRGIQKAPNLIEVDLDIGGTKVADITEIGRGIKTAPKLAKFKLKCAGCKDLVDVQELGRGIGDAANLTEVYIDLLDRKSSESDVAPNPLIRRHFCRLRRKELQI